MDELDQVESWVAGARAGDRLALTKLLAALHPGLRDRAAARLDPSLKARISPDDALQEAYLEVARHIETFEDRGPGSFQNWITTILDRKLIDICRAGHRKVRDVARDAPLQHRAADDSYWNLLDQVYTDSGTPSRVVRRAEAFEALLASIDGLSDVQRTAIRLRFLEGLPVTEVAQRLEKTEAAVVALCQRALRALRTEMDRRGEFTRG